MDCRRSIAWHHSILIPMIIVLKVEQVSIYLLMWIMMVEMKLMEDEDDGDNEEEDESNMAAIIRLLPFHAQQF